MGESLYDFEIVEFRLTGSNSFSIVLESPYGARRFEMAFERVRKLHVDGLSLHNVVLDISLFQSPADAFGFDRACSMLGISSAGTIFANECDSILLIEASSGAEIACLFEGDSIPELVPVLLEER